MGGSEPEKPLYSALSGTKGDRTKSELRSRKGSQGVIVFVFSLKKNLHPLRRRLKSLSLESDEGPPPLSSLVSAASPPVGIVFG